MSKQQVKVDNRIKNDEDMKKLMAFEQGKYVIQIHNEIVTLRNSPFFNKIDAETNYFNLMKSLQEVLKNPENYEEQKEAIMGLNTISIQPFKLH